MRDARVALMTAPNADVARAVVEKLVEERLVACGNIVPGLQSIYRWRGAVEREPEVLVILKTSAERVPALLERAPALHPYEVPELLVLPVLEGYAPYLQWLAECVEAERTEA